ncbi:MAG: choice-of-anchor B domain-containing protein [Glaciecola sp.]|jgi:choice-of-anchor B domain-containing protein
MSSVRVRLAAVAVALGVLGGNVLAADPSPHQVLHERKAADADLAIALAPTRLSAHGSSAHACINAMADQFPCSNVDLLAHLPFDEIGGGVGNDIWGWTDPETGREYALMGKSTGMAIIDVTEPIAPRYLGELGTMTVSSSWRDIKVHDDTAYIVSESTLHGIQAFDLTQLRGASSARPWAASNWQVPVQGSHNIVINEQSGRAYAVGSKECGGGPYVIDLATFTPVAQDGCVDIDGYTHDMQCVVYDGPDTDHTGAEICLASNLDTVTIWDLTEPASPVMLSRIGYPGARYTHQGWLTSDAAYFLVGDELDEIRDDVPTTTLVFDVRDLDDARLVGTHQAATAAIDHNMYVTGNLVHQANYRAGYRILELTDPASATLTERAYFDVYPADDEAKFNGAWSVYPYFASGTVIISSIEGGLFVVRPRVP